MLRGRRRDETSGHVRRERRVGAQARGGISVYHHGSRNIRRHLTVLSHARGQGSRVRAYELRKAVTALATTATIPTEALPTLTPKQMERVASCGRRRTTEPGDVLFEPGDKAVPTFVVVSGELQVVLPANGSHTVIVTYGPGQFSGEVNAINGRPAIARLHVTAAGEVIELNREQLLTLIQTDAELSELFMRALILRRVALVAG